MREDRQTDRQTDRKTDVLITMPQMGPEELLICKGDADVASSCCVLTICTCPFCMRRHDFIAIFCLVSTVWSSSIDPGLAVS